MRVHGVCLKLVRGHPGHGLCVGAGHRIARRRVTHEVNNHKVVTNPPFRVPMHTVEYFHDRADLDIQAGFLADFPLRAVSERFAQIQVASRQGPLSLSRLMRTPNDQRATIAHDHGADTHDRLSGVFSGHMKSHTEYLTFQLPARVGFENITPAVEAAVRTSGIREGLVLVNAMHITASVFINDDERGLHQDYAKWLEALAPFDASPTRYAHNRTGEDNADAHMKRQIMGREVVVAVTKGALDFGPWEQIFYGEFDGKRRKRVLVKIIGE